MVIGIACLGGGIFLSIRRLGKRIMGESSVNYLLEHAALPPQKRLLGSSMKAD